MSEQQQEILPIGLGPQNREARKLARNYHTDFWLTDAQYKSRQGAIAAEMRKDAEVAAIAANTPLDEKALQKKIEDREDWVDGVGQRSRREVSGGWLAALHSWLYSKLEDQDDVDSDLAVEEKNRGPYAPKWSWLSAVFWVVVAMLVITIPALALEPSRLAFPAPVMGSLVLVLGLGIYWAANKHSWGWGISALTIALPFLFLVGVLPLLPSSVIGSLFAAGAATGASLYVIYRAVHWLHEKIGLKSKTAADGSVLVLAFGVIMVVAAALFGQLNGSAMSWLMERVGGLFELAAPLEVATVLLFGLLAGPVCIAIPLRLVSNASDASPDGQCAPDLSESALSESEMVEGQQQLLEAAAANRWGTAGQQPNQQTAGSHTADSAEEDPQDENNMNNTNTVGGPPVTAW